jgi:hypothetical protein
MALGLVATMTDHEMRKKTVEVSAQASGNYVAGGDTTNLTSIANPKQLVDAGINYPGTIEDWEVVSSPAGYQGVLVPGATLATWKLKVLQGGAAVSSPSAEIPAAAYPAALLTVGNVFILRFKGPKLRM